MKRLYMAIIGVLLTFIAMSAQSPISGDWTGKLQVSPQMSLKLVFHIAEGPVLTMDSPDQSTYGIDCEIIYLSADSINFKIPRLMVSYGGCLKNDRIEGIFEQGGMRLPLTLEPFEKKENRPQTPQPPFPYSTEDVTVSHGDVSLAGTFTVPADADASTPVVVMVTGSGQQNRDEEVFGHRPFAVIADYLARKGIASLRYDDRGYGESKGDVMSATTADFADDAASVVNWLRVNKKFNKVGLLGHSEGGVIAYMLGAKPNTLDFLISIAGPAVRGDSILVYQNMNALSKLGIEGDIADEFKDALYKAFRLKIDNPKTVLTDTKLSEIYPTYNDSDINRSLAASIRSMFSGQFNAWMQYFITYSPSETLASLEIPAFLIYGAKDRQVPAQLNAEAAGRLTCDAVIKVYPGLNHLMQHADTGNMEEYSTIEETISPEVLSDIVSFINRLK